MAVVQKGRDHRVPIAVNERNEYQPPIMSRTVLILMMLLVHAMDAYRLRVCVSGPKEHHRRTLGKILLNTLVDALRPPDEVTHVHVDVLREHKNAYTTTVRLWERDVYVPRNMTLYTANAHTAHDAVCRMINEKCV